MDYMTISEAATKWNLSNRRIQTLCSQGRIPGAERAGYCWLLPKDAEKPVDARIKSGKYIGYSEKYKKPGKKNATDGLEGRHERPRKTSYSLFEKCGQADHSCLSAKL